jgi:tetratricopeptide (TPR) repeat protein
MKRRFCLSILAVAVCLVLPEVLRGADLRGAGRQPVHDETLSTVRRTGEVGIGRGLVEAALLAEGIQNHEQRQRLQQTFSAWQREVLDAAGQVRAPDRRAALVLQWMHERILCGRYDASCDKMTRLIRDGDYNCLTATIAYLELGRYCDLPLIAAELPGHVRVRLTGPSGRVIETTGAAGAACGKPGQPGRPLSDAALVAKIHYNRGVRLFGEARFPEAIAATKSALQLDPSDAAARSNLLAAYNNWALALCRKSEFEQAAAVVTHARQIDPSYAPLASNELHVHQQWVLRLCEAGRFADALAVLESGFDRRPDAPLFTEGRHAVRRWWLESLGTVNTATLEMD